MFDDMAASRQGCNDPKEQEKVTNRVKGDPKYKDILLDEGNLAWKAIQKIPFLQNKGNQQLAELFMSLSGSILIQKPESTQPRYLASLVADKGLIAALLNGGEAKIYQCDERKECLNPTEGVFSIPKDRGFVQRVYTIIQSIQQKSKEDDPFNEEEKTLIEMTPLPILKIVNTNTAFYTHDSQPSSDPILVDLRSKAELIATEILYQYLTEILQLIQFSSRVIQYPPDVMNDFFGGISHAEQKLRTEREAVFTYMAKVNALIKQAQFTEGLVKQSFSAQLNESIN